MNTIIRRENLKEIALEKFFTPMKPSKAVRQMLSEGGYTVHTGDSTPYRNTYGLCRDLIDLLGENHRSASGRSDYSYFLTKCIAVILN